MEENKNKENSLKYLIALNHFPKFGTQRLKRLKKNFINFESAFKASLDKLIKAGIEENIAQEFVIARNNINPDELLKKLEKENIKIVTIDDKKYPRLLKEIYGPPELLFYKGKLKENEEFSLAVVGARKYSPYGQMVTEQIITDLAKNNLTIVSGLALGIDALAHSATLKAGGRTIAVLGSGLDKENIYPSSNRYLAEKILEQGGAIISEFTIGVPPLKHNFPQRNRIISGLSLGTLIIEAGEKSGSLITAHHALEQNREIFAIPGNIYSPVSAGTNALIKRGAHVVTKASDIIETLNLAQISEYIDNKEIIPESKEEGVLLKYLTREPTHINELIRLSRLDTNVINSTLTIMEMKGLVKNLGNMQYVLAR